MLVQDGSHITGIQQDYLSPILCSAEGGVSKTIGTANRAYLYPIWVPTILTITNFIYRVAVTGGNIDLGIYDKNGTKIATTGSFATPAATGHVTQTALSAMLFPHLNPYYWAIAGNTTTTALRQYQDENASKPVFFRELFFDTAFPLPSSFNLAAPTGRGVDWRTFSFLFSVSGGPAPS